jgi:hypothetical protein
LALEPIEESGIPPGSVCDNEHALSAPDHPAGPKQVLS